MILEGSGMAGGVKGKIHFDGSSIAVDIDLPLLLRAMKGRSSNRSSGSSTGPSGIDLTLRISYKRPVGLRRADWEPFPGGRGGA